MAMRSSEGCRRGARTDGRSDGRSDRSEGRTGRPGGVDPQTVFEELYGYLARVRSGSHPHRMATRLLRRTSDSTRLVALVERGRRAVLFDVAAGSLLAVPFDEHGLEEEAAVGLLATAGPATWVARNRDVVGWLHPRYRAGRDG